MYYPKMDLAYCMSTPIYTNIDSDYRKVFGKIQAMDWKNQSVVDNFIDKLNTTYYAAAYSVPNNPTNVSFVIYNTHMHVLNMKILW